MFSKRPCLAAALAVGALLGTASQAAPADQVSSRVRQLRELGAAFKAVRDGLRAPPLQTILIQMSARQIVAASREQYSWFPPGSGPQPGVKTAAKPEIWSDPARFKKAQDAFAAQALAFQAAAATGDAESIRAQFAKLGETCKSCHEQFRTEED